MRTTLALVAVAALALAAEDPYLHYVKSAREFKRVRQDPKMMIGRWDTWIYMPWRFRWTIGTGDEGGQFCKDYGFNGGFTDHGDTSPLPWLEKWNLRFYNDHTAGKGYLYLYRTNWKRVQRDPRAIRFGARGPVPLDDNLLAKLKALVTRRVNGLKKSPMRVAYALDDEISWGSFVKPIPWRIHANDADYARWLANYYGDPTVKPQYVTPDFVLKQLGRPLKDLDFSPLLDRITYNDSYWANFLGELVETANRADPDTPCGFVGGQAPNMWGGYDYAKLCKKIQFIEAYNLASSQEIIRSFNPQNAMPQVTTHFHSDKRGTANDVWQTWYYFAHGNRGMIGWVQGWFDGKTPRPWLRQYAPTMKEVGRVQGPKLVGARWLHDGVAIYYSHPSIQVSWCLDIEPHGSTWVNRFSDARLGTSHLVRKAWEYLLSDSGLQYNFIPYDEVVVNGVPAEYQVVILPACYALSDMEAERLGDFVRRGGTLIADFACGIFDQHGKGRSRGALDDLFAITHDGTETKRDFFGPRLWVETDQDRGYSYKRYRDLFATVQCTLKDGFALAEKRLGTNIVRKVGNGTAVYLNLSPQRYLQYREEGKATQELRDIFIAHVLSAGLKPWVEVVAQDGERPRNCEVTYWHHPKTDRTYCFVLQNAPVTGSAYGGGGVEGLIEKKQKVTVKFRRPVPDLTDERTGKRFGRTATATLEFNPVEALMLSFAGKPPK